MIGKWESQEITDRMMLDRYRKSKDKQIEQRLLQRFEPICRKVVSKVCVYHEITRRDSKEDILVEARLGALVALKSFKGGCKLSTWVWHNAEGYAKNACKTIQKRGQEYFSSEFINEDAFQSLIDRHAHDEDESEGMNFDPFEYDWEDMDSESVQYLEANYPHNPDVLKKQREKRIEIYEIESCLSCLSSTQRMVARLCLVDGMTQTEVAERLNVRQSNISYHLKKAKILLDDAISARKQRLNERLRNGTDFLSESEQQRRAAIRREKESYRSYGYQNVV